LDDNFSPETMHVFLQFETDSWNRTIHHESLEAEILISI